MELSNDKKNQVISLLTQHKALAEQERPANIHTYKDIRDDAGVIELTEEINKLQSLFNDENLSLEEIQAKFKVLCKDRQLVNRNTCLSYAAQPEGACNHLYWELAKIVFEPESLRDMLAIIMPNVTTAVKVVDGWVQNTYIIRKKPEIKNEEMKVVAEEPISSSHLLSNEKPGNSSQLNEFVFEGKYIFPVSELESLPYLYHASFQKSLANQKYEALMDKIYRHNDDLKYLYHIISFSKPAIFVMSRLVHELKLSGEKFSKEIFAADSALTSLRMFKLYVESHPDREALLELQDHNRIPLGRVIDTLDGGGCVEEAAKSIEAILQNKKYESFLNRTPSGNNKEYIKLTKQIDNIKIIKQGYDDEKAIPEKFLSQSMEKIELKNPYHFIDVIIALPSTQYSSVLKSATIEPEEPYHALPPEIAEIVESLSKEQQDDFLKAIKENKNKLGGDLGLLRFAVSYKNKGFFDEVVNGIPEDERREILGKKELIELAIKRGNVEVFSVLFPICFNTRESNEKKLKLFFSAVKDAVIHDQSEIYQKLISFRGSYLKFSSEQAFNQDHVMLLHALRNGSYKVMEELLSDCEKNGSLYALLNKPHADPRRSEESHVITTFELASREPSYETFEVIYKKIKNSRQPLIPLVGSEIMERIKREAFDPYLDNPGWNENQKALLYNLLTAVGDNDSCLASIVRFHPLETLKLLAEDFPTLINYRVILNEDQYGENLLYQAIRNRDPRVVTELLLKLPEEERYEHLQNKTDIDTGVDVVEQSAIAAMFNVNNDSLSQAVDWRVNVNAEGIIDAILKSIPPDNYHNFYHDPQMYCYNVLQLSVISNSAASFDKLIENYSTEQIKHYLTDPKYRLEEFKNRSPLHYLFSHKENNFTLVHRVLNLFSAEEFKEVIANSIDGDGDDLFDTICQYASPETFNLVAAKLTREDFLGKDYLIRIVQNEDKRTVEAYKNVCRRLNVSMMDQISDKETFLYNAMTTDLNSGETIVSPNLMELKAVFSKEEMAGLLKTNTGFFPLAALAPLNIEDAEENKKQIKDTYNALFKGYDDKEKFAILNHKSAEGKSLLHVIAVNRALTSVAEEDREYVSENYRFLLEAILKSLPLEFRIELLSEKNNEGKSFYDLTKGSRKIAKILDKYNCNRIEATSSREKVASRSIFEAVTVRPASPESAMSSKRKGKEPEDSPEHKRRHT